MIIAIDDSGAFALDSKNYCFFIAAHIRQRKTLYSIKKRQFETWEQILPKTLKNAKGEIKSSELEDKDLLRFVREVIISSPYVGITPTGIRPIDNPATVVEKHRTVQLYGIEEGISWYSKDGNKPLKNIYTDFKFWLKKLSYNQYLKIFVLGRCIQKALANTVGHAITGKYEDELLRIRFFIDRDFIKSPQPEIFWRELLRNQIFHASKTKPIPLLNKWQKKGHPFLEKYAKDGVLNFNELFRKHCKFVNSHENFEIRIADNISTIFSRYHNKRECVTAYDLIKHCILADGTISKFVLNDFDLSAWHPSKEENPWLKSGEELKDFLIVSDKTAVQ